MIEWPDTLLPCPTINTGIGNQSAVARTEMDSGRVRQRQRFTRSAEYYSVEWVMTISEFRLFKSVVHNLLCGGAGPFLMYLPTGHGGSDGESLMELAECRIINGIYQAENIDKIHWSITAQIEVQDPTYYFSQDAVAAVELSDGDIEAINNSADSFAGELLHFAVGHEYVTTDDDFVTAVDDFAAAMVEFTSDESI